MDTSSELTIFRSLLETMIQLTLPDREYFLKSFVHHVNHHARLEDFTSLLKFKRREDCVDIFGVEPGQHLGVEDLHHANCEISVSHLDYKHLTVKFVDVIAHFADEGIHRFGFRPATRAANARFVVL